MSFHLLWSLFRAGQDLEAVHETTGERASHAHRDPTDDAPLTLNRSPLADRDPTRLVGVRSRSDGSGPRPVLPLLSVGRNLLSQGPHHAKDPRLCRESTRARAIVKNASSDNGETGPDLKPHSRSTRTSARSTSSRRFRYPRREEQV